MSSMVQSGENTQNSTLILNQESFGYYRWCKWDFSSDAFLYNLRVSYKFSNLHRYILFCPNHNYGLDIKEVEIPQ